MRVRGEKVQNYNHPNKFIEVSTHEKFQTFKASKVCGEEFKTITIRLKFASGKFVGEIFEKRKRSNNLAEVFAHKSFEMRGQPTKV